jgi:hypothetical protein
LQEENAKCSLFDALVNNTDDSNLWLNRVEFDPFIDVYSDKSNSFFDTYEYLDLFIKTGPHEDFFDAAMDVIDTLD